MAVGIVYIINEKSEAISQFKCDFNQAIMQYHGKRCPEGRYFVTTETGHVPYKILRKPLKNVSYRSPMDLNEDQ